VIADGLTILWKESREILRQGGSARRGWISLLLIVGVFGIFMPLQTGRAWVETPMLLVYWAWIPLLLVSSMVADSFAGERERHTLETLLASRLSDRAILFGKFGAAVAYGWGITMVSLIVSLVTVNLSHGQGALLLYPLPILVSAVVISLLASMLIASIGVLVSLRASTVQQAAQRLSIGMMIVIFGPLLLTQALPAETRAPLGTALQNADFTTIILIACAILIVLNIVLLAATLARFRRARLILD
jgi:ABC-2 type transport system permease protein